jgi:hypothetical protein
VADSFTDEAVLGAALFAIFAKGAGFDVSELCHGRVAHSFTDEAVLGAALFAIFAKGAGFDVSELCHAPLPLLSWTSASAFTLSFSGTGRGG